MRFLLKIFPQKSHINATFPLARKLSENGHQIIYSVGPRLSPYVEAQGFKSVSWDDGIFAPVDGGKLETLTMWTAVAKWHRSRQVIRHAFAHGRRTNVFRPILAEVNPDFVLLDSPYTFLAFGLIADEVPFATIESMVNLDRSSNCPPLDTTYVPADSMLSRGIVALHWARYAIKSRLFGFVGIRVDYNRRFIRQRAIAVGLAMSEIRFDRYFHLRLATYPEFILSPQPFDFHRELRPRQYYVGPSVGGTRVEGSFDRSFHMRFAEICDRKKSGAPLVLCSLGTGGTRYRGAPEFLQRVLDAARGERWQVIVAIGSGFAPEQFVAPENAHVFQTVPQLQVLDAADLMITHGGINSITECIRACVPMVVFPGTTEIDQAGNAARVVYHGLGVQGRMARDSGQAIRVKVRTVLDDKSYRARVGKMCAKMISHPAWTNGADVVASVAEECCRDRPAAKVPPRATPSPSQINSGRSPVALGR